MAAPVARVLVVDGSEDVRQSLVQRIAAEAGLEVVADCASGREALILLARGPVDVVFINGPLEQPDVAATVERIMIDAPRPIVLGLVADQGASPESRSLEAGAVACVADPVRSPAAGRNDAWLRALKAMAEVRVVTRRGARVGEVRRPARDRVQMVAVGASTGGPIALRQILASLPDSFPVPVLIVQHIARGFLPGMADWLRKTTGCRVLIAEHGQLPQAGHAYLAPDDFELGLGIDGCLRLARPEPAGGPCPSVAGLFREVSDRLGPAAIGVMLSGMGRDGAVELRRMRDRGAVTIAQDQASSVIHGMPGEAIALGGATHVLPADRIGPALVALVASAANTPTESS